MSIIAFALIRGRWYIGYPPGTKAADNYCEFMFDEAEAMTVSDWRNWQWDRMEVMLYYTPDWDPYFGQY